MSHSAHESTEGASSQMLHNSVGSAGFDGGACVVGVGAAVDVVVAGSGAGVEEEAALAGGAPIGVRLCAMRLAVACISRSHSWQSASRQRTQSTIAFFSSQRPQMVAAAGAAAVALAEASAAAVVAPSLVRLCARVLATECISPSQCISSHRYMSHSRQWTVLSAWKHSWHRGGGAPPTTMAAREQRARRRPLAKRNRDRSEARRGVRHETLRLLVSLFLFCRSPALCSCASVLVRCDAMRPVGRSCRRRRQRLPAGRASQSAQSRTSTTTECTNKEWKLGGIMT